MSIFLSGHCSRVSAVDRSKTAVVIRGQCWLWTASGQCWCSLLWLLGAAQSLLLGRVLELPHAQQVLGGDLLVALRVGLRQVSAGLHVPFTIARLAFILLIFVLSCRMVCTGTVIAVDACPGLTASHCSSLLELSVELLPQARVLLL